MSKVVLLCALAMPAAAQVTAQSYIVMAQDGRVLVEHNADALRPMASITKLVTLSEVQPSDEQVFITADEKDTVKGTHMRLKHGAYTQSDLFAAALIASNNEAAKAVGKSVIDQVNHRNGELGLELSVIEPSGLDPRNVGTARALAKLVWAIKDTPAAHVSVERSAKLGKTTNSLIGMPGWEFMVSKTGYIKEAGGCVVTLTKVAGE